MELGCGTIIVGAILLFIGSVVWNQVKESRSSKEYDERQRKAGEAFRVVLLRINRLHGRITFGNDHLDIFGRPLVDEYFGFLTGDRCERYHIPYNEIKDITYKKAENSGHENVTITDIRGEAIILETKKPDDAQHIIAIIKRHILEMAKQWTNMFMEAGNYVVSDFKQNPFGGVALPKDSWQMSYTVDNSGLHFSVLVFYEILSQHMWHYFVDPLQWMPEVGRLAAVALMKNDLSKLGDARIYITVNDVDEAADWIGVCSAKALINEEKNNRGKVMEWMWGGIMSIMDISRSNKSG